MLPYCGYVGYGAFFNLEAVVPGAENETEISLHQRIREANPLLNSAAPWDNLTVTDPNNTEESGTISLAGGTRYTEVLSVENTGDGVVITHQIFSGENLMARIAYSSSANLVTEFDTFAIGVLGGREDRTNAIDLYAFELTVRAAGDALTWAGYPVEATGWVDTGDFLGFIYPIGDFIYIWNLSTFMYLPETEVTPGGAWAFAFK